MTAPIHIMKVKEGQWIPKDETSREARIKTAVWVIVAVIILLSIVFGENLFGELQWPVRVLLVILCVSSLFVGGRERVAFDMEIRFYEDYLEVYRDKRYYKKSLSRRETYKFSYSGLKQVVFRSETKRINIFGIVEGTFYKYNRDGSLPSVPSYHKTTDSICYFYTDFLQIDEFIEEFETYCPVKITIDRS